MQIVHFLLVPATFVICLRAAKVEKFRPVMGLVIALFVAACGAAVNGIGAQLDLTSRATFLDFFAMKRETIWHGSTLLAIAYGLVAFCVFRLIVPRKASGDHQSAP